MHDPCISVPLTWEFLQMRCEQSTAGLAQTDQVSQIITEAATKKIVASFRSAIYLLHRDLDSLVETCQNTAKILS